jgi:hypothetical protein
MADEPPPGWTRHTLNVNRRDRPEPAAEELPEGGRFSGRRFVFMMFILTPIVFALFVGLLLSIVPIR